MGELHGVGQLHEFVKVVHDHVRPPRHSKTSLLYNHRRVSATRTHTSGGASAIYCNENENENVTNDIAALSGDYYSA